MSDAKGESVPWTIRSVPVEVRQKAVRAAHAADVTMGEWITEVVNRATDPHHQAQVIQPTKAVKREVLPLPDIDLGGLGAALNATIGAIQAAGEKPPKNLGQNAAATLNKYMSAARGLSPRPSKPKGVTLLGNQESQSQDLVIGLDPKDGS